MSDEKKQEVLEQAETVEEAELDAVNGGGACACVLGGGGEFKNGMCRCVCPAIGGGAGEECYTS